jgi:hypothetical protein
MANTREHRYSVSVTWNGNLGSGTSGYRDYSRNYEIGADGKAVVHGSADPAFEETAPAAGGVPRGVGRRPRNGQRNQEGKAPGGGHLNAAPNRLGPVGCVIAKPVPILRT